MPYFLERLRFHSFILSSIHCNRKRKAITTIANPKIESPITSFQFQKSTVFELQLVNKTRHNSIFKQLRYNFVFDFIVLNLKISVYLLLFVLNCPQLREYAERYPNIKWISTPLAFPFNSFLPKIFA